MPPKKVNSSAELITEETYVCIKLTTNLLIIVSLRIAFV